MTTRAEFMAEAARIDAQLAQQAADQRVYEERQAVEDAARRQQQTPTQQMKPYQVTPAKNPKNTYDIVSADTGSSYTEPARYDLNSAQRGGVTQKTIVDAGFSQKQIDQSQKTVPYGPATFTSPKPAYTTNPSQDVQNILSSPEYLGQGSWFEKNIAKPIEPIANQILNVSEPVAKTVPIQIVKGVGQAPLNIGKSLFFDPLYNMYTSEQQALSEKKMTPVKFAEIVGPTAALIGAETALFVTPLGQTVMKTTGPMIGTVTAANTVANIKKNSISQTAEGFTIAGLAFAPSLSDISFAKTTDFIEPSTKYNMPEGWYVRGDAAREPLALTNKGLVSPEHVSFLQGKSTIAELTAGPKFKELPAGPTYTEIQSGPQYKQITSGSSSVLKDWDFSKTDISPENPWKGWSSDQKPNTGGFGGGGGGSSRLGVKQVQVAERTKVETPDWYSKIKDIIEEQKVKTEATPMTKELTKIDKNTLKIKEETPLKIKEENIIKIKEETTKIEKPSTKTAIGFDLGTNKTNFDFFTRLRTYPGQSSLSGEDQWIWKDGEQYRGVPPVTAPDFGFAEAIPNKTEKTLQDNDTSIIPGFGNKEKTSTRTDNLSDVEINTDLFPKTNLVTKTETKTQLKNQTQPENKTKTRTEIQPKTQPETKTQTDTPTESINKTRNKLDEKTTNYIKLPKWDGSDNSKAPEGTIAWRQGKYWKAIYPPYDQDHPVTLKEAPAGATVRTGPKSAYRTAQILKGKFNGTVYVDLGIEDVKFTGHGNTADIQFTRDGQYTNVGASNPSPRLGMGRKMPKNGKRNITRRINKNVT